MKAEIAKVLVHPSFTSLLSILASPASIEKFAFSAYKRTFGAVSPMRKSQNLLSVLNCYVIINHNSVFIS